jgi:hypothetical protein
MWERRPKEYPRGSARETLKTNQQEEKHPNLLPNTLPAASKVMAAVPAAATTCQARHSINNCCSFFF